MQAKWLLWAECIAVFIGLPALLGTGWIAVPMVTLPLLLVTIPATLWLGRSYGYTRQLFWLGERRSEQQYLRTLLSRFVLSGLLLLVIAWLMIPERLFDLPRHNPGFWLLFLLVYPVFSVYPQELLYRVFFFRRYAALVSNQLLLILFNALLFSWSHFIFHSMVAMLYTLVGSLYFSHTYLKTGSLRLLCLEHALYGGLLISIGYGHDLLTSTMIERLGL